MGRRRANDARRSGGTLLAGRFFHRAKTSKRGKKWTPSHLAGEWQIFRYAECAAFVVRLHAGRLFHALRGRGLRDGRFSERPRTRAWAAPPSNDLARSRPRRMPSDSVNPDQECRFPPTFRRPDGNTTQAHRSAKAAGRGFLPTKELKSGRDRLNESELSDHPVDNSGSKLWRACGQRARQKPPERRNSK
jgi:hypothetical protein